MQNNNEGTYVRIHVTKDILKKSMNCATGALLKEDVIVTNCALAIAVRDILPDAAIFSDTITPFPKWTSLKLGNENEEAVIWDAEGDDFPITKEMTSFITMFDNYSPKMRLRISEQSFNLLIPNWVIEQLTREHVDFAQTVIDSPTLELV